MRSEIFWLHDSIIYITKTNIIYDTQLIHDMFSEALRLYLYGTNGSDSDAGYTEWRRNSDCNSQIY